MDLRQLVAQRQPGDAHRCVPDQQVGAAIANPLPPARQMDVQRVRIGQMQMRGCLLDRRHVVHPGERRVRHVQVRARLGHHHIAHRRIGLQHERRRPIRRRPADDVAGNPRARAIADSRPARTAANQRRSADPPQRSVRLSADWRHERSSRQYPGSPIHPPRCAPTPDAPW